MAGDKTGSLSPICANALTGRFEATGRVGGELPVNVEINSCKTNNDVGYGLI
ncbi:MAG: hypothetical protein ACYC4S_01375 [Rhodoferax sp.]